MGLADPDPLGQGRASVADEMSETRYLQVAHEYHFHCCYKPQHHYTNIHIPHIGCHHQVEFSVTAKVNVPPQMIMR